MCPIFGTRVPFSVLFRPCALHDRHICNVQHVHDKCVNIQVNLKDILECVCASRHFYVSAYVQPFFCVHACTALEICNWSTWHMAELKWHTRRSHELSVPSDQIKAWWVMRDVTVGAQCLYQLTSALNLRIYQVLCARKASKASNTWVKSVRIMRWRNLNRYARHCSYTRRVSQFGPKTCLETWSTSAFT
jgi:hypothetical protein